MTLRVLPSSKRSHLSFLKSVGGPDASGSRHLPPAFGVVGREPHHAGTLENSGKTA